MKLKKITVEIPVDRDRDQDATSGRDMDSQLGDSSSLGMTDVGERMIGQGRGGVLNSPPAPAVRAASALSATVAAFKVPSPSPVDKSIKAQMELQFKGSNNINHDRRIDMKSNRPPSTIQLPTTVDETLNNRQHQQSLRPVYTYVPRGDWPKSSSPASLSAAAAAAATVEEDPNNRNNTNKVPNISTAKVKPQIDKNPFSTIVGYIDADGQVIQTNTSGPAQESQSSISVADHDEEPDRDNGVGVMLGDDDDDILPAARNDTPVITMTTLMVHQQQQQPTDHPVMAHAPSVSSWSSSSSQAGPIVEVKTHQEFLLPALPSSPLHEIHFLPPNEGTAARQRTELASGIMGNTIVAGTFGTSGTTSDEYDEESKERQSPIAPQASPRDQPPPSALSYKQLDHDLEANENKMDVDPKPDDNFDGLPSNRIGEGQSNLPLGVGAAFATTEGESSPSLTSPLERQHQALSVGGSNALTARTAPTTTSTTAAVAAGVATTQKKMPPCIRFMLYAAAVLLIFAVVASLIALSQADIIGKSSSSSSNNVTANDTQTFVPTFAPSLRPIVPTLAPSQRPIVPTFAPSLRPIVVNSTTAPVTAAPRTDAPTTMAPSTTAPTFSPTLHPATQRPTLSPTSAPSILAVITTLPSSVPSQIPCVDVPNVTVTINGQQESCDYLDTRPAYRFIYCVPPNEIAVLCRKSCDLCL